MLVRLVKMKFSLLLMFSLIISTEALKAEESSVFGIFSSFHKSTTSGDLIGAEIHVLPHPVIVVQGSEGRAGVPELFKVKIYKNNLLFKVPKGSKSGFPPGYYEATVINDKMVLVSSAYKTEIPRHKSYWEK